MKADAAPSIHGRRRTGRGTLLLVETDAELRKAIELCLRESGWRILSAGDDAQACRILESETPEVLVWDAAPRPDRRGTAIDLFRRRQTEGRRGFVLITADQHLEEAWRRKYRPDAVIFKPFDVRRLARRISRLTQDAEG
jgi:DNA-binding response OmpR family regulator